MPMLDAFLTDLPAPEHLFPVQLAVKVDQSRLEALEHAADLVELEQEIIDLPRDGLDTGAQRELLGRLAQFGAGLRVDEVVMGLMIVPPRMEGDQVVVHTLEA